MFSQISWVGKKENFALATELATYVYYHLSIKLISFLAMYLKFSSLRT